MDINPIDMVTTLANERYITESRMYSYLRDMQTLKEGNPVLYNTVSSIVEGAYHLGLDSNME